MSETPIYDELAEKYFQPQLFEYVEEHSPGLLDTIFSD